MSDHLAPDAVARVLLGQIEQAGFTLEDLAQLATSGVIDRGPTTRDYLASAVLPALSPTQRRLYTPYAALIADGYPQLCGCVCATCLDHLDPIGRWTPCPCVTTGTCDCRTHDLRFVPADPTGAPSDCRSQFTGVGDIAVRDLSAAAVQPAIDWAALRARKRSLVRTRKRSADGRRTRESSGSHAAEHTKAVISAMYRHTVSDPKVTMVDVTAALRCPSRDRNSHVGLDAEQLERLWAAAQLGRDPELDTLIVWFLLETGGRRSTVAGLRVGDLDLDDDRVHLSEKTRYEARQPVSANLTRALISHALTRGDILLDATDTDTDSPAAPSPTVADVEAGRVRLRTDAPVFYLARRRPDGSPWPVSDKVVADLFRRLRSADRQLDDLHLSPHTVRRTAGAHIERVFGRAVAAGWLRHQPAGTTDLYTRGSSTEVDEAAEWWTARGDNA